MRTVLNIEGMTCTNCVKHVNEALTGINGVTSVSVKLDEQTAEIEHLDDVSPDILMDAVIDAGYDVGGFGGSSPQ